MFKAIIAAVLTLLAAGNAIADDQVFITPSQPAAPMQLKPSLTCAGILITTTDKKTSDEVVRDFLVIVDYTDNEARVWLKGYEDAATVTFNGPDILFSASTSWGKDESLKRFINGYIDRLRGTMYVYDTLWSGDGPVSIRHWYLQCKENWDPSITCFPWGPGICLMQHSNPAPVTLVKLTTGAILNALSGGLDPGLCRSLLPVSIC